jgi:hypothetical protein
MKIVFSLNGGKWISNEMTQKEGPCQKDTYLIGKPYWIYFPPFLTVAE